jgi:hypothetical protein
VVNTILFSRNTTGRNVSPAENATCWRIPAIVYAPPAVIAFVEARKGRAVDGKFDLCYDGSPKRIAYRRSVDGGREWGEIMYVPGIYETGWVVSSPAKHAVHLYNVSPRWCW